MDAGLTIGALVLYGLFDTPLFILWTISLCLARRKSDPARTFLPWFKAISPIWIVGIVFLTIGFALQLYNTFSEDFFSYSESLIIAQASAHLWSTGTFLKLIADVLLLITFSELCGGFLLCIPESPRKHLKPTRIALLAAGGLIFVLDIAYFGVSTQFYKTYFSFLRDDDFDLRAESTIDRDGKTMSQLSGAVHILLWIVSLPIVGYASFVVHKTKNVPHLVNSSALLLTATILDFIRLTVEMALNATYVLPDFAPRAPDYVDYIVSPLFDSVLMFVILVLLFTVSIRKQKGVWSTPQGWLPSGVPGFMPQGPGQAQAGNGYVPGQQPYYYYPPQPQPGVGQQPMGQYPYPQYPQPVQQQGVPVQQVQHPEQEVKAVVT
ncbi:hypothetical protein OQA88_7024 [Cercophora sp. LCS_1]